MWSRSTLVTTATSASTMFTASSRPPSPTSRISASRSRAREQPQRRERAELEVGERRSAHRRVGRRDARILDRVEGRHDLVVGSVNALDPDAFVVARRCGDV